MEVMTPREHTCSCGGHRFLLTIYGTYALPCGERYWWTGLVLWREIKHSVHGDIPRWHLVELEAVS